MCSASTYSKVLFSPDVIGRYKQAVEPSIIDIAQTPEEYERLSNNLFKSSLKLPDVTTLATASGGKATGGAGAGAGAMRPDRVQGRNRGMEPASGAHVEENQIESTLVLNERFDPRAECT